MMSVFPRQYIPYSFHSRRSRRHYGKPEYQRNLPSAFFGLVVTGLFAVTMAEPNWFHLQGGRCAKKHIGLYTIFGSSKNIVRGECIDTSIVSKLRVCAGLCLLGIFASMFQFSLDVCGPSKKGLKWLRKNSIGNIISVLMSVTVILTCYWITLDINQLRDKDAVPISGRFDVAFYLVIGAGIAAIIATSLSLLQITCEKRERRRRYDSDMQLQLISSLSNIETTSAVPGDAPPAYNA